MKRFASSLLLACCWATSAVAQGTDRNLPITLEADRVEIDERTGVSLYQGHVTVTQGRSLLTADRVTVTRQRDGDRVVAEGSPATFSQPRDDHPEPVQGRARRIEHRPAEQRVILTGDAEFTQGGDRFTSNRIEYDTAAGVVRAGTQTAGDGGGRVRIVIQPRRDDPQTPSDGGSGTR